MKIAIIGASAGVGLLTVQQALNKKHHVVSLSRNIDTLPKDSNLTTIKGSATNVVDVKKTIAGADAVIVTLGTGANTKATKLYTDAALTLIQAQKDLNTNIPFIILTGFGAGNSGKYQGFFMKIIFALLLKAVYKNKTQMEEMIASSAINWEFVRPGMLKDKPFTGAYRITSDYNNKMNIDSINRADVADFLIKQAENPTCLGKYPALSNT